MSKHPRPLRRPLALVPAMAAAAVALSCGTPPEETFYDADAPEDEGVRPPEEPRTTAAVCKTDSTVCSTLTSTQCTITTTIDVSDGCSLDFGTRLLVLEATGKLSFPGRHIRVSAGALQLKSGSRLVGSASTAPGGTVAITLKGQNCLTGSDGLPLCLDSAGSIDVSSTSTHGGAISVQLSGTGSARLTSTSGAGDWLAKSQVSGPFRGSISIRTEGNLTVDAALNVASTKNGAGGFIGLESREKLTVSRALDARGYQYDGGEILVRAWRDLNLTATADLNASGGSGGAIAGDGGIIMLEVQNEIVPINGTYVQSPMVLLGKLTANGVAPSGGSADGGRISVTGAFTVSYGSGSISATGTGDLGRGGTVSILANSNLVLGTSTTTNGVTTTTGVSIDASAKGSGSTAGGVGGSIELKSQGALVDLPGTAATLNASSPGTGGVGGSIHVFANTSINQAAPMTVAAGASGGVAGSIKLQSGGAMTSKGNLTASGASKGGFVDLWAGSNLTFEKGFSILANGTGNGAGGLILLEANNGTLRVKGTLSASGAGTGSGGSNLVCGLTIVTESTAIVRALGADGVNYFASPGAMTLAGTVSAGNANALYYNTTVPTLSATFSPAAVKYANAGVNLLFSPVPAVVDGGDGKGGRTYDFRCPLETVAPRDEADIVDARTLRSATDLSTYKASITVGGQAAVFTAGGDIEAGSDTLEIRFKSPVKVVGFRAWNGTGAIAAGSEANLAKPLLLELTAAFALDATPPLTMRFWTYQGLHWTCGSGGCQPLNDNIGQVDGDAYEPGFFSIESGDVGAIREVRVKALNFSIDEGEAAPTDAWTVSGLVFGTRLGNASCWEADADWRVVSQYERSPEAFQHWLRTEQHASHTYHTRTQTWEFNRYQPGTHFGKSVLQGSGAKGALTSPAVQLEVPYVDSPEVDNGADKFCDLPGQRDWASLYHMTHFHFQGQHETEDATLGDPGTGSAGNPFDPTFCNGRPSDPGKAAVYDELMQYFGDGSSLQTLCAAYNCCKTKAPIVDSAGNLIPSISSYATPNAALVNALLHPVCGASCLQTMQWERDACVPRQDAWAGWGTDDQRLIEYSLDNGKSWRRFNWMKDRYHGGYPGKWHYNHGHALQDGDGMLLMDEMTGFDWDQDGVAEMSSIDDLGGNDEWDHQFRLVMDPTAPAGDLSFRMPAMRVRFLFIEDGNGTAVDRNGDGMITGWRVDDVSISNYEEWVDPRVRFFDGTGELDTSEGFFMYPDTRTLAKTQFDNAILSYLKAAPLSCDDAQPGTLECRTEWDALMTRMDQNQSHAGMDMRTSGEGERTETGESKSAMAEGKESLPYFLQAKLGGAI